MWEKGEEDEGFQDDWLSQYSKGSHGTRASNGSTMSSFSIGGCGLHVGVVCDIIIEGLESVLAVIFQWDRDVTRVSFMDA